MFDCCNSLQAAERTAGAVRLSGLRSLALLECVSLDTPSTQPLSTSTPPVLVRHQHISSILYAVFESGCSSSTFCNSCFDKVYKASKI